MTGVDPPELTQHWDSVWSDTIVESTSWFQPSLNSPVATISARADLGDGVIDVGGGASGLVDALLARGFTDVAVLDISVAALAHSKTRLGDQARRVDWIVDDICAWQPLRAYKVWHDRALLHFLNDPHEQFSYANTAARAVESGGTLLISTFARSGPTQCSGLPVTRHDATSLAEMFRLNFELMSVTDSTHLTPWGDEQRFTDAEFRRC